MAVDLVFVTSATEIDPRMVFGQVWSDPAPLIRQADGLLAQLMAVKLDIRSAVESLGANLTGVAFGAYVDYLDKLTLDL